MIASLLLLSWATGAPEDWPCWRGPRGDNVSLESEWKDDGRELWRKRVGAGHSSCALSAGRLYTLGFVDEEGEDRLWCLDAGTGEPFWSRAWSAQKMAIHHSGGTLTTPALADGRVWCSSRAGVLRSFDATSGEEGLAIDLVERHSAQSTEWGFGGSPLCVDGRVIVNAEHTFAIDPASGETIWVSKSRSAMYSTPMAFEHEGQPRLAVFAKEGLVVLDRESGEESAFYPWKKGESTVNASTPVVIDDRIFISSGYDHGCALLRFGEQGLESLFESKVMRTELSGCVLFERHLYGYDGAILKCIDLDGKEHWRKRGLGQGALTVADGRLILTSAKGELVVARASPKGFEERSRLKAFESGPAWASPVLCNGLIYARSSSGELVCYDHR